MPRQKPSFHKRDLKTIIELMQTVGLKIGKVEIAPGGRIVIVTGDSSSSETEGDKLDRELAEYEKANGQS
jgi:hypothetical protein